MTVGSDERELERLGSSRQELIGWIAVWHAEGRQRTCDFKRKRSLNDRKHAQAGGQPGRKVSRNLYALLSEEQECLPHTDWRKPEFVLPIVQFLGHAFGEPMRLPQTPKPNVRV